MSPRKARDFRTLKQIKEANDCDDQPNERIGFCILHFPKTISIDILSRLPLAYLLWCRCVCKTWRNLIKDSKFAKLHFSRAEAHPPIRTVGPTHVSRTLYFVDQPPEGDIYYNSWSNHFEPKVVMKLDIKLKIPLNNIELAMSEKEATINLNPKRKRVTKLRHQDHKLNVVNSCNGFLCLSEPLLNNPVMVCHPISGEFIKLPSPTQTRCESSTEHISCGLGFCPKTNKYKVIRMFEPDIRECTIEPLTGMQRWFVRMAEIHTLGTNTWEMVGYAPSPLDKLRFCTYLNGALHWLYLSCDGYQYYPYLIAAFDFGKETFQSIAIPPAHQYDKTILRDRISIGQIRGCLCICYGSDLGLQDSQLWMMKTYGDQSSWTLKIDMRNNEGGWLPGLYEPMSYFKDGSVLYFHPLSSVLFCYDPNHGFPKKFLKVHGIKSRFEAIPYIPSFYSLKDAVMVDGVEVYNIKSRCGGLKLQGESKAISLVQENADWSEALEWIKGKW